MVEICGKIVAQSNPFWSSGFSMGWTELERKREREREREKSQITAQKQHRLS
jgi:hypothetical protein